MSKTVEARVEDTTATVGGLHVSRALYREERGVMAVIVAITAVMLFGVGALAVDLGNALARKRVVQSRADLAALAGGSQLPASTATVCPTTHPPAGDLAVAQVADYLVKNWPQDDSGNPSPTQAQLTPLLVDPEQRQCGEVSYPDENSVRVVTPDAQVNFGLAQVMGFNSTQVAAAATAEIKSPVLDTLPFYAFTGCDYGQQTISEPNNGHHAELSCSRTQPRAMQLP